MAVTPPEGLGDFDTVTKFSLGDENDYVSQSLELEIITDGAVEFAGDQGDELGDCYVSSVASMISTISQPGAKGSNTLHFMQALILQFASMKIMFCGVSFAPLDMNFRNSYLQKIAGEARYTRLAKIMLCIHGRISIGLAMVEKYHKLHEKQVILSRPGLNDWGVQHSDDIATIYAFRFCRSPTGTIAITFFGALDPPSIMDAHLEAADLVESPLLDARPCAITDGQGSPSPGTLISSPVISPYHDINPASPQSGTQQRGHHPPGRMVIHRYLPQVTSATFAFPVPHLSNVILAGLSYITGAYLPIWSKFCPRTSIPGTPIDLQIAQVGNSSVYVSEITPGYSSPGDIVGVRDEDSLARAMEKTDDSLLEDSGTNPLDFLHEASAWVEFSSETKMFSIKGDTQTRTIHDARWGTRLNGLEVVVLKEIIEPIPSGQ
ncbi:hypothetical protein EDC04DRAFT_2603326 [Pisolithus marmoratus]|nr:hypothetical protein EDC04DRAFT_2603326 [Pisolithus marmoratus]